MELAGETKKLALAIPLAIVGSVLCCLLLYLGLQVAFIGALSTDSLLQGWQHLSFTGDVGPFAGLAASLGLFWLVKLLYIDAVISPSGAGLVYVTSTARILYAMGQIGYLPRWLTYLNKQDFPVAAIMTNFAIGMFLFLPFPGWQSKISRLLHKLGAVKILNEQKQIVYSLPREPLPLATKNVFSELIMNISANEHLIVIHTNPGSASLIGRWLDYHREALAILGNVAGDDTLLVIPQSMKTIHKTLQAIKKLVAEMK